MHSGAATSDQESKATDTTDNDDSPMTAPAADNVIEVGATASLEVGAPVDENDDATLEDEPPAAVLEVGSDAGIQWPTESEAADGTSGTDGVELIESFETATPASSTDCADRFLDRRE